MPDDQASDVTAPAPGAARDGLVDPRGPRFGAVLTTVLLASVLLLAPSAAATALLALQTAVFALGAFGGLRMAPYGWIYRTLVRPRLQPPTELEEEAPPRFAQSVGFAFAAVALGGVAMQELLPWNTKIGINSNYRAAVETLTNQISGILDIL